MTLKFINKSLFRGLESLKSKEKYNYIFNCKTATLKFAIKLPEISLTLKNIYIFWWLEGLNVYFCSLLHMERLHFCVAPTKLQMY